MSVLPSRNFVTLAMLTGVCNHRHECINKYYKWKVVWADMTEIASPLWRGRKHSSKEVMLKPRSEGVNFKVWDGGEGKTAEQKIEGKVLDIILI